MTITRNTILTMLAFVLASASVCSAQWMFRGIPVDQGDNLLASEGMIGRIGDFYIDVQDNFSTTGPLHGSQADTHRIGFVPPISGLATGPLQGQYADAHGAWTTSNGDYAVANGSVSRTTGTGTSIATTPWRAHPGLGDDYLLEMTAVVAAGESVSLGYLGDINEFGADQGLAGPLGQLVFEVERRSDNVNMLDWSVAWEDNGIRQTATGSTVVALNEEINMQLGWLDTGAVNDDIFDAVIGTTAGNQRLISDSMGNSIDVHAVGFDVNGTDSYLGNFTAAVPEPTTGLMALLGMVGMISIARRRA